MFGILNSVRTLSAKSGWRWGRLRLQVAGAALLLLTTSAQAAETFRNTPTVGSLLWKPTLPAAQAATAPLPLLVVLHGDGGSPQQLLSLLIPEAQRRGLQVLALACPRDQGCSHRSFWQWNPSPAWLTESLQALAQQHKFDASRVYLLGWSGGASYLADVMAQVPPQFAAVALLGGGMPTRGAEGCAACKLPIYYSIGEKNPLRALAEASYQELKKCAHEVSWHVVRGADHAAEWESLQQGGVRAVLDFLLSKAGPCPSQGRTDSVR